MNEEPVVLIEKLTMNYGVKQVLKGIDLTIYPGQVVGYIGPNGAGKSTTVKLMLGLAAGYRGKINIFGTDVSGGDVIYKKRIGYVPEAADLYDNLTPYEYLTFIGELYGMEGDLVDQKAQKLLDLFDLKEVYHSRLSSFSKGMKQKVLIISSLLHNPDLLFLDEPIAGLDANSVMVFKEILAQLAARGKTILYSSHIMDVVEKISDRIVLLNEGRIVADGSFNDLKEQSKEGSLEGIFNQLTGFEEHEEIAQNFVSIVEEV